MPSPTHPTPGRLRSAARRLLGHEELLPGQQEAIQSVVGCHDTLAVMPTGSGKSAVYQLAGTLRQLRQRRAAEAVAATESAEHPPDAPFALNSRLRHRRYGLGTLQDYEGERMVVLFDDSGYKTLDVPHSLSEGLVEPADGDDPLMA